ncbi:sensor histidine kinase [Actinoallomurus rhizosphaericola]|uniref:sensor histidine kinase n=1 Tax=Actinoallomurus rhizosphaericola TaxID=2952536 RepID=UPI002092240E|nr:ATP-binding protein [Actinoallomurus rhizosphaericola]MCO5997666.1 ATP-binding protein [Actinoallomurus rhizosphaericola]
MRHSLLVRLVASTVLIAVCSIVATAWLAARSTSGQIRHQQGQTLASDARINDALLGYAASHPRWDGVEQTVRDLGRKSDRRIALVTEGGTRIADSAAGRPPLPARASAVVDPLAVDVSLVPGAATDRIDPRAVGPFQLPESDRVRLRKEVDAQVACRRRADLPPGTVVVGPSGRPYIREDGSSTRTPGTGRLRPSVVAPAMFRGTPVPNGPQGTPVPNGPQGTPVPNRPQGTPVPNRPQRTPVPNGPRGNGPQASPVPTGPRPSPVPTGIPTCARGAPALTATEMRALNQLSVLVAQCKHRRVDVRLDETGKPAAPASAAECLARARRTQLRPYVAPAALLYIGSPEDRTPGIDPYGIAGVTAVILALAVAVSVIVATRLVRPVRAVTAAARRMRAGDGSARVMVRAKGEVGELGAAFNEMSEHLDRMERQRKAMVSDVSHELRTPLSNILGWLEAAQDGVAELDPALTASLVEEAALLRHIIDDLQQLALADAGQLRVHPEPADAADLVEQIATVHRAAAAAAGLTLTTEVRGTLPLHADPVRLRQAVGNLLSNAVRYTPAGGRVTLRAYADGGDVLIEVADTGPGIAPEHLPYVFDRFWRAEKSRNRQTGGSGLGLAIVRHLAEAHGGSATARSEPGRGATFTLRLPGRTKVA